MIMKILLVQPPFIEDSIASVIKYEPMGLVAIASYIRENKNNHIQIYDANIEKDYSIEKIAEKIFQYNPQILGMTAMTNNINNTLKIAQAIKKNRPDIITVIGGIHATISPEEVLSDEAVDFIVVGEGEITFDQLLKNINQPEEFKNIDGLGYKENNKIIINQKREFIKDLDQLPFSAHDLLKLEEYRSPLMSRIPFVNMFRSRGCPFQCIFCDVQNMFGRIYRVQSPQRTIREIDYLVDKFKIREIAFKDSEFILNKENVSQLCDLLIDRGYDLIWSCNARVDCGNYQLFQKMKKAGCQIISFGAESGDNDILKILKKGITVEQIREAIKQTKAAKLKSSVNFMIGSPGETKETIEKTINLAKELNPDYVHFSFTTPFPGSELREMAIKNNWLIDSSSTAVTVTELTMNATNLPEQELKKYVRKAYRSFYFRPSYILKRLTMLNKGEIQTSLLGLSAFLKAFFLKRNRKNEYN